MNKVIGLAMGAVAMMVLSGCGGGGAGVCNTKLSYLDYDGGAHGGNSLITLHNNSDYTIDEVYSGTNGDDQVNSVNIPTVPGNSFTANSANCGNWQILRIVDDENCEQSVAFFRGCNETAVFEVTNNF